MSYPRLSALAYSGPGWQRVLYLIPACTALLWYIAHLGHIWPSGRKHHLGARYTVLRIYWGYYVVIHLMYWSIIFADVTIFDNSFIYLLLWNINWITTMIYSKITHNYVQTWAHVTIYIIRQIIACHVRIKAHTLNRYHYLITTIYDGNFRRHSSMNVTIKWHKFSSNIYYIYVFFVIWSWKLREQFQL